MLTVTPVLKGMYNIGDFLIKNDWFWYQSSWEMIPSKVLIFQAKHKQICKVAGQQLFAPSIFCKIMNGFSHFSHDLDSALSWNLLVSQSKMLPKINNLLIKNHKLDFKNSITYTLIFLPQKFWNRVPVILIQRE